MCLAQRWRLRQATSPCPSSGCKALAPIVYHLDPSIPPKWRPCFRHGVEAWDAAFQQAGWAQGTVLARSPSDADWPADYDAADIRFSSITWTPSLQAVYSVGPSTVDPRSGEIVDADIVFAESWARTLMGQFVASPLPQQGQRAGAGTSNDARDDGRSRADDHDGEQSSSGSGGGASQEAAPQRRRRQSAGPGVSWEPCSSPQCSHGHGDASAGALHALLFGGAGGADEALVAQPFATVPATSSTAFVCEALAQITMHEVGHTLGLRHNFAGSMMFSKAQLQSKEFIEAHGLSGSVMDYLVRRTARHAPLVPRRALRTVRVGSARHGASAPSLL